MNGIKGSFYRLSPSIFADKIGIPPAWFVISYRWMSSKKKRRISHGQWYRITSEFETIYRILRFSPNIKGGSKQGEGQIVLDWPGWIDLFGRAEDVDGTIELRIAPARWWEYPKLALAHPDPTHRLAGELGLLSVALGILSIVLAII